MQYNHPIPPPQKKNLKLPNSNKTHLAVPGLAHAVDLLVHLRAVVVAVLPAPRHGARDAGGVPGADARHLAEAAVGLAGQAGDAPARHHALAAVALLVLLFFFGGGVRLVGWWMVGA